MREIVISGIGLIKHRIARILRTGARGCVLLFVWPARPALVCTRGVCVGLAFSVCVCVCFQQSLIINSVRRDLAQIRC